MKRLEREAGAEQAVTTAEPAANATRCSECRRHGVRIVRVHRGERFCQTCYKRLFKRRLCPQCGNFARLPRFEQNAVCLTCENARPCVRCGKTDVRVGMRTPYGPACIACTPYFKPPEPCERCGTPSRWLSRREELEHDLRPLSPVRASRPRDLQGVPAASSAGTGGRRAQALPSVQRAGRDPVSGMPAADAGRMRQALLELLLETGRATPDPVAERCQLARGPTAPSGALRSPGQPLRRWARPRYQAKGLLCDADQDCRLLKSSLFYAEGVTAANRKLAMEKTRRP